MMRKGNNRTTEMKARWLLTFNDMMTLLFAFFVLIISMSSPEVSKVKGVAGSVRKVLGMEEVPKETNRGVIKPFVLPTRDLDIDKARTNGEAQHISGGVLDRKAALSKLLFRLEGVQMLPLNNGLLLSFDEPLLFLPAAAEIVNDGRNLLKNLGIILQRTDVSLCVEDNVDDSSFKTGKFPSPWELALARAVNVVKYLVSDGGISPERLSAAGYGGTRSRVGNIILQNPKLKRQLNIILTFPEN